MTTTSTLDGVFTSTKSLPNAVAASQEISDRDSVFTGTIYRANSISEAQAAIRYHTNVVHGSNKASHEIAAWRCMDLKKGRSGLKGPDDFEIQGGYEDDGEDYAGKKVLKTMESEAVIDAVVIVSRWYGGTLLGPIRFTHIENCAREVCRAFKEIEEIETYIRDLQGYDKEISRLRAQLPPSNDSQSSTAGNEAPPMLTASNTTKALDYEDLLKPPDLARAKRLVRARQSAIKSVSNILAARKGKD